MRGALDLFIVTACAIYAAFTVRAAVSELRTGKPTTWLMSVAYVDRESSPKLFAYRQVILWITTVLFIFFAASVGADWIDLL
jgi:hypothetical protein